MISDNLDGARSTMADLENRLNKLSDGKFFGGCYSRGLETYTVGEIKRLCKEVASPEFMEALKESAQAHRDFYCDYNKRLTLRWAKPNQSSSEYNIRRICEWLGIPDRRGT